MTNEQARKHAIKLAWIETIGEKRYNEIWQHINGLGEINNHQISLQAGDAVTTALNGYYMPIILKGIKDNNGWIRIEPDGSNLPERSASKGWMAYSLKGEISNLNSNGVRYYFRKGVCTHYKPIKEEPKPLY